MDIETVNKNIQELNEFLQDDSLSFDYDKWGSIICRIQSLELKSDSQQSEIERLKGELEVSKEMIIKHCDLFESMKGCGNCGNYSMHYNMKKCLPCDNKSNWQPLPKAPEVG